MNIHICPFGPILINVILACAELSDWKEDVVGVGLSCIIFFIHLCTACRLEINLDSFLTFFFYIISLLFGELSWFINLSRINFIDLLILMYCLFSWSLLEKFHVSISLQDLG